MNHNYERIKILRNQIDSYKEKQSKFIQSDWQYTYFTYRIEEAELEIRERSNLEEKMR